MKFEGVTIYHCKSRVAKVRGFKFWVKSPIPGFCENFEENNAMSNGRCFKSLREVGEYILFNQKNELDNGNWKPASKK